MQAEANQAAAKKEKKVRGSTRAAEADMLNVRKALLPYAAGAAQAEALVSEGYKLNDLSGQVCLASACKSVDPITALFFFTGRQNGLGPTLSTQNASRLTQDPVRLPRTP